MGPGGRHRRSMRVSLRTLKKSGEIARMIKGGVEASCANMNRLAEAVRESAQIYIKTMKASREAYDKASDAAARETPKLHAQNDEKENTRRELSEELSL